MKLNYDCRHRVVEGEQLSPGDRIWIPDLKAEGTVMTEHVAPRSVVIQTPNEQVRRNRRMTRREYLEEVLQSYLIVRAVKSSSHWQQALRCQILLQPRERARKHPEARLFLTVKPK